MILQIMFRGFSLLFLLFLEFSRRVLLSFLHELVCFLQIIIFLMSDYELERLILGDAELSKYFEGGLNPIHRENAVHGANIQSAGQGSNSDWSESDSSCGSDSGSSGSSVAGDYEPVPQSKRKRGYLDRREAHVLGSGELPPHPEGEQKRLEEVIHKLGYWIDQLTEERRAYEAILRDRLVFGVGVSAAASSK